MKFSTVSITIGIIITLCGFGMFCLGVSTFTYQGNGLSPFIYEAGKYSFIFCIPTLIIGIGTLVIGVASLKK